MSPRKFSFNLIYDLTIFVVYIITVKPGKESLFTPHYNIDYNGWHIDGTLTEWNYTIVDESYDTVAIIRKEIFNFTDTYVIDVKDPENALDALMFVLAIDAEKCTKNKRQNF